LDRPLIDNGNFSPILRFTSFLKRNPDSRTTSAEKIIPTSPTKIKLFLTCLLFASASAHENRCRYPRPEIDELRQLVSTLGDKVETLEDEVADLRQGRCLSDGCKFQYNPLRNECTLHGTTLVLSPPEQLEVIVSVEHPEDDVKVRGGSPDKGEDAEDYDVVLGNGMVAFRVEGPAVFKDTMGVTGRATFENTVVVESTDNNVEVDGNIVLIGDLAVCGETLLYSDATIEKLKGG
jgi:hypothetical protein